MSRTRSRTPLSLPMALIFWSAGGLTCSPYGAPVEPSSRILLPPRAAGPSDKLFAGLAASLRRAERDLSRTGKERPYFLAAATIETILHEVQFSLGQPISRSRVRQQWVYGQVRVGSRHLDSAVGSFHPAEAARLPSQPDALAVGRVLVPVLKRAHRFSVKRLAETRKWLKKHPAPSRPPEWTVARPVSHIARTPRIRRPSRNLRAALRRTSAVFRRYPDIHESWVSLRTVTGAIHTVTSESTRLYREFEAVSVGIQARTQAPDGEELELLWQRLIADPRHTPTAVELTRQATDLARAMTRLRAAPRARKIYTGPVLFEDDAATAVLLHTVGLALAANRSSLQQGERVSAEGLIGRRILPAWLSVVDDPTARRHGGLPLRGHYQVDDEGIRARRVQLVSRGRLKTLLGSRRPSRPQRRSTGHGRYTHRPLSNRALPSNLIFIPRRPLTRSALRRRFLALLRSRQLTHGYIVRQVRPQTPRATHRPLKQSRWLPRPTRVFRIDASGHETLVRGYTLMKLDQPTTELPRMVAMGGPALVAHWFLGSGNWITVAGHAFILDTAYLLPMAAPSHQPPRLLPSPLRR